MKKAIIIPLLILTTLFAFIYYTINYLNDFPDKYPGRTLSLGKKINNFVDRITLPIKIARLSSQPVDEKVMMPVYSKRVTQVSDTWLAPRSEDRLHEGQDIFAPRGTPIFSSTRGYVYRITDQTLGGNSVFVIGAGGRVYYYTHLERYSEGLRVGQEVTTDTVLGFVGNSGNAATTPPHLHFGVYDNNNAINPLTLLIDRS